MSTAFFPLNNVLTMIGAAEAAALPPEHLPEAATYKKSNHQVKVVRIAEIEKHANADTLGIVRIGGYQVVIKLDDFRVGDLAAYIQPDSVVPAEAEFAFLWEGKGYIEGDVIPEKYRRITVRKFRKQWSEGLLIHIPDWVRFDDHGKWREIAEGDDVSEALGVTHYEPPEPQDSDGGPRAVNQRSPWPPRSLRGWLYWFLELVGFRPNGNPGGRNQHGPKLGRPVYDVEAFKNFPDVFRPGEAVMVTEKIHGSNARFLFEDGKFHIGSRTMWKNPASSCVWVDAAQQNPEIEQWCRAHPGYTLYGEVVPTQGTNFLYGSKLGQVRFFVFDILRPDGEWAPLDQLLALSSVSPIPQNQERSTSYVA